MDTKHYLDRLKVSAQRLLEFCEAQAPDAFDQGKARTLHDELKHDFDCYLRAVKEVAPKKEAEHGRTSSQDEDLRMIKENMDSAIRAGYKFG